MRRFFGLGVTCDRAPFKSNSPGRITLIMSGSGDALSKQGFRRWVPPIVGLAIFIAMIFVVRREEYVYLVPFVEDEHTVFLKTIIPSRKATKQYLGEESDDES